MPQWAWNIGAKKSRAAAQTKLDQGTNHYPSEDVDITLQTSPIVVDEDGRTAPESPPEEPKDSALRQCLNAAWGYKTGKGGQKEVGYGFHQHTIVRTPPQRERTLRAATR